MAQLDRCLGALLVDCVCQRLELRHYLLAHPELVLERETAPAHRRIGYCGHRYASPGHGRVVVKQFFGRPLSGAHCLESR